MDIKDEKILAIKAFYLGHKINESLASKPAALEMISYAITHLVQQGSRDDRLYLAFYHLLRSEVMRENNNFIGDRLAAQAVCQEIDSALYRYFMTIEQVTLAEKKMAEIAIPEVYAPGEYVGHSLVCNSLGITYDDLTDEELLFIDHATLLDLFSQHGLTYQP